MAAPILITVWFGANDSALEGSVQAVDIKQYGENLKDIVQLLRHEHQKCNIVFITPPPCDTETWRRHLIEKYNIPFDSKPNRTFENAQIFAKRALEVADELSIPVVDINTIFTSQKLPFAAFLNDGLHLSDAGNALVFDSLKALINHKFPNIAPGRLLCDGKHKESNMHNLLFSNHSIPSKLILIVSI